jgi:hypothetical protein
MVIWSIFIMFSHPIQSYSRESRIFYFSVTEMDTTTSGLRWIFHMHSEFSRPAMCNNDLCIYFWMKQVPGPRDMQEYYMLFGIFARDVGLYSLSVFYIAWADFQYTNIYLFCVLHTYHSDTKVCNCFITYTIRLMTSQGEYHFQQVNTIIYHIFGWNMFVFACPIIDSQCWLFALKYPYWPLFQYVENMLIWLKYDFMHIFMHHLSLYFDSKVYNLWDHCADTGSWIRGQIRTYDGKYGYACRIWISIQMSTSWVDIANSFKRHCTDRHCLVYFWNQTRSWTKATLLRIYFRNLSVQRSFLQYKSQCTFELIIPFLVI